MVISSYYTNEELKTLGLKSVGDDVRLSRKASLYGVNNISIGNHVRIDDFCVLSGNVTIGNYVHVNPFTGIYAGDAGVILCDYVNLSSRVTIYAVGDDYSGEYMTSPLLPSECTNIRKSPVVLCRHVIVGASSCIMPGVTIGEGVAIGTMSLVKHDLVAWGIYAGIPCRRIKDRSQALLQYVKDEY